MIKFYLGLVLGLIIGGGMGLFFAAVIHASRRCFAQSTRAKLRGE